VKYKGKSAGVKRAPKGFGFEAKVKSYQKNLRKTLEEHGRAVVGVVADGAEEGTQARFYYTVPVPTGEEPTLLTAYPGNTATWLLNRLGDDFKSGRLPLPPVGGDVDVEGYLGAHGELPLRLRTLRADQAEFAYENLTCQSWETLPVVVVTLPDPTGKFPEHPDCDPRVALAGEFLNTVFTDDVAQQHELLARLDACLLTLTH